MSNSVSLPSVQPAAGVGMRWAVALVLAAWFALVVTLGAAGAYVTPPGTPPVLMALGVNVPLVVFFVGLALWPAFREFVAAIDVRVNLSVHAGRFVGLGFLGLYAYGLLPGSFALPAGLGDIAIAVTAPVLLFAVLRRPNFIAGKTFAVWNVLGILDLAVALSEGTLNAVFATGAPGEISMEPMARLPLVIIPVYFVPILIMLHVSALMQARRAAVKLRTS
jgi:hypothetical protein